MQIQNFCLHPVKGEFSKRNGKGPYKFRVDLLIACSNQNNKCFTYSLFFKMKLSKKTILGIYPNKDHYEVKDPFLKHLSKDKTLCIHPHKDHYKVNLQRYFKTTYKHFKARQMIQTSELRN